MPFQMTHLEIAYNIVKNTPGIKNPGDFILGAIAPDSVHLREGYNSDMKKKSHLCFGTEKWGETKDNKKWLNDVYKFLEENKNQENSDFIKGYCCHVITDIQNNIKFWTPFLLENSIDLDSETQSDYNKESYNMDYELYLINKNKKTIWKMLKDAKAYNIINIVFASDIEKMRNDILFNNFVNRKHHADVSLNKYITLPKMQEFIVQESKYIKDLLYK